MIHEPAAAPAIPSPTRVPVSRRTVVRAVGAVLAITLVIVGVAQFEAWRASRPPFAVAALHAHVVVSMRQAGDVQAAIGALGPTAEQLHAPLPIRRAQRYVVGQVRYTVPAEASSDAEMVLFVIDRRTGRPVTELWGTVPGPNAGASAGWDGRYAEFAERYPWLAGLAPVQAQGGGVTDPGQALSMRSNSTGPLTFVAALDPDALPVTDVATDLMVVIGLVGDHVYWAAQLHP